MPELSELTIDKIISTFKRFRGWEDRYKFIISLGKKLPPLPQEAYAEKNLVEGCMSQVWMISRVIPGNPPRVEILADSDAHIVKGLVAILLILYSGKTKEEIRVVDLPAIFGELELENHLSMNRRNGFFSMVKKIQELADQAAA